MSWTNFWAPDSGLPREATVLEKAQYQQAITYFDQLQLPDVITQSPNQRVITINFDGTGNNKNVTTLDVTNIGLLDSKLDELRTANPSYKDKYVDGIGTEGPLQLVQQALATGAITRVREAVAFVSTTYAAWHELDSSITPYIVVTGFSRGSAEARLFMNVIDTYGIPAKLDTGDSALAYTGVDCQASGGSVHMSALLYDTVKTGMSGDFGIPGSVDSVVHITCQDERRVYFPLTSIESSEGASTNRLIEVQLPGVHSDMGGGYPQNGVSQLNLYFAKEVLRNWGVPLTEPTLPNLDAVETWVMHDSRSLGTRIWYMFGTPEARNTQYVASHVPTAEEVIHLNELYAAIPGGWQGAAGIPDSIQSPPYSVPTPPTPSGSSISSIEAYDAALAQYVEAVATDAGLGDGTDWIAGYENTDSTIVGEAVFAAMSTFQPIWGPTPFCQDEEGNVSFVGATDYQSVLASLTNAYATSKGEALNTAALFGQCAYVFGLTSDLGYQALKTSMTSLDPEFQVVLSQYDGSGAAYEVVLADAHADSVLEGSGSQQPTYEIGFAGNDSLNATASGSVLHGGDGSDSLTATGSGIQLFGDAGNDTLAAGAGGDTLTGGQDNDDLTGGIGADTYVYLRGDGQDGIHEQSDTAFQDVLTLADISVDEAGFKRVGNDLQVLLPQAGSTTVKDWFLAGANKQIEFMQFQNQTFTSAEVTARVGLVLTDNADTYTGTTGTDIVYGMGGGDNLFGGDANDLLSGGAGIDFLDGGRGQDTLIGGAGNDTLGGGAYTWDQGFGSVDPWAGNIYTGGIDNDTLNGTMRNDLYHFNLGDGLDTIIEPMNSYAGADILRFGAGITENDIKATASGTDLVLSHINGTDRVTIKQFFASTSTSNYYRVERVEFDSGAVWDVPALIQKCTTFTGTGADDTATGLLSFSNELFGAAGIDTLTGGQVADRLRGGLNNDNLLGRNGNDTYLYALGDGYDTISEEQGTDTVKFEGINSTEVQFYRQNYEAWGYTDLRVDVGGGDGVVIPYQLYNPSMPYIENFEFADVTLVASQVQALALLG